MPEIRRPTPKIRPQPKLTRATIGSPSQAMAHDRNYRHGACHKNSGRGDGSCREPRNAAHTMTRRASSAEPGAKSDQEARGNDLDPACRHLRLRQRMTQEAHEHRRRNETRNE